MAEYLQILPNKLVLRHEVGKQAQATLSLQVRGGACIRRATGASHRRAARVLGSNQHSVWARFARHAHARAVCAAHHSSCLLQCFTNDCDAKQRRLPPLQNPTDDRLAYKVKTTVPLKYSVSST